MHRKGTYKQMTSITNTKAWSESEMNYCREETWEVTSRPLPSRKWTLHGHYNVQMKDSSIDIATSQDDTEVTWMAPPYPMSRNLWYLCDVSWFVILMRRLVTCCDTRGTSHDSWYLCDVSWLMILMRHLVTCCDTRATSRDLWYLCDVSWLVILVRRVMTSVWSRDNSHGSRRHSTGNRLHITPPENGSPLQSRYGGQHRTYRITIV